MKKRIYPSWRYHKSKPAKIIHSENEHVALGNDWAQSPAHFQEPVSDDEAPSTGDSDASSEEISIPLAKRRKNELSEMAEKLGYNEKDIDGKTKDELVAMIEEIEG